MAGWDEALDAVSGGKPSPSLAPQSNPAADWDSALDAVSRLKPESALLQLDAKKGDKKYDPEVSTFSYLWNEAKKVPGGLVGIAPDAVDWLLKKYSGQETDFGNITRKLQTLTGADVKMRPPSPGAERAGILTQHVLGSVPFAAGALTAGRGALGATTEIISGLGGGAGQVAASDLTGGKSPVAELTGNILGSMLGFRAGNIAEKSIPLVRQGIGMMASKEARAQTALKAKGLIEGSPEWQSALKQEMDLAKNEILSDLTKAYAQEDLTVISKALDQYSEITKRFPGFKASVGEITGNEPVLAMQARLESRNIPSLEERGARLRANEAAIREGRSALVPERPGAARASLRGAQVSIDEELRALGQTEEQLKGGLADISTRTETAAVPGFEAGAQIKQLSREGYATSKGRADKLYQRFREQVAPNAQADATGILNKLDELKSKFVFDQQPEVLSLIPKVAAGEIGKTTAEAAFAGQSLLPSIKQLGGVNSRELIDLVGEAKSPQPGLFSRRGLGLDDLATQLRERNFLIPDDAVDGGVQFLRDMIQDELRGKRHYSADVMDRLQEVRQVARRGEDTPKSFTILQLDDLAAATNRDIQREKARSNPDRRVIAQLIAIRQETQNTIKNSLTESGNISAVNAYSEASRYFGQEHAPRYLEGVNLKLRLQDSLNEQRIKPEQVVSSYFKPNGTTEARKFNIQFADNGAAKETLARGVFDLYKKEVIDAGGGVINATRHDFFMRKYAAPLSEYPWIAKRLSKNEVAAEIANRLDQTRQMRGEVATSEVAKAAGARDADAFIEHAVSDKRFMFNALVKMKPDDKRNMAIAVLNKAWDESSKGSQAVQKFLENEDNVKMLFRVGFGSKEGLEHLNNIKLLARALEINEAAPKTSPMSALTEDTLKAKTGTTFVQVMSALRSIGRRPGSGDWFAMVFGAQMAKARIDAKKNDILKEQLFDPELLKATITQYRASSMRGSESLGELTSTRSKQILSKLWDISKAAVGEGAPSAAAKRLPIGIVASEEPSQ